MRRILDKDSLAIFTNTRFLIGIFLLFTLWLVWQNYSAGALIKQYQFDFKGAPQKLSFPYRLKTNQTLDLKIRPDRSKTQRLRVNISFKGNIQLTLQRPRAAPLKEWSLSPRASRFCRILSNTMTACHFFVADAGKPLLLKFHARQKATVIYKLSPLVMTSTHKTTFLGQHFNVIILILTISVPIAWVLHRSRRASQWYIFSSAVAVLWLIQPVFLLIFLSLLLAMFYAGKAMQQVKNQSVFLLLSLLFISLGFLLVGKYGMNILYQLFPKYGSTDMGLPLGISYFVIRLVDTQLCWYRKELADVSLREYLCYILFPPTIAAGPIETLANFRKNRLSMITRVDIAYGLARVGLGLFKKIVIAGTLYTFIYGHGMDNDWGLFGAVVSFPSLALPDKTLLLLIVIFFYAYMDFSAYSDIAVGLSRLMGYQIVENFTWPILATNLHQYWRSWHRSLSLWCFRNIYFPLTISTRNIYLPLYATMMAVGLWHRLDWSWVVWAIYHASGLSLLGYLDRNKKIKWPLFWVKYCRVLKTLLTLIFVIAGYSFVSLVNFATASTLFLHYWYSIISLGGLL